MSRADVSTKAGRLRWAREQRKPPISARQAAKRLGYAPSTYTAWENSQNEYYESDARKMARFYGVKWEWLLTGEGERTQYVGNLTQSPRPIRHAEPQSGADTVDLPEIDLRVGASYAGGFAQEHYSTDNAGNLITTEGVRARWGFPAPFLREELGISPGRAHILQIRGDSMTDALFDGDRAVIDLDDTDVSQGGIFAIRDDNGSVIIKQVELIRASHGGERRIRCTSRNVNYAPFELPLADPVAIIGRVACKITRL